jgi:hypothetical protein
MRYTITDIDVWCCDCPNALPFFNPLATSMPFAPESMALLPPPWCVMPLEPFASPLHTTPATKKISPCYLPAVPRDIDPKPMLPPCRPSCHWPNSAGQRTLPEHPSLWPPLGILQDHCNYILAHIPPVDPPYPFLGLIPPQSNYKRIPRATLQPLQTLKKLTRFPHPRIWNTSQPP